MISCFNASPAAFHATNLVAHVIATLLAYGLLWQLLRRTAREPTTRWRKPVAAAAGALLFGIHPLQIEAVAWVSGLRDVLGGMFGMAALWLFVLAGDGRRRWLAYTGACIAFLLALGSKPGMVCLPAVALLIGWHYRPRFLAATLLPWFVIALAWAYLTGRVQPSAELARGLAPIWARPLIAADALAFYLGKLVWPAALCAEYGRSPDAVLASGKLYWTWLLPAAVAAALAAWRRTRWALVPLAVFVVALGPTLGLVPFNYQVVSTVADRYAYFALIGPAWGLGVILARIRVPWPALSVAALAVVTMAHLRVWTDSEHLFAATLRVNPRSWKALHNFGNVLDNRGDHKAK